MRPTRPGHSWRSMAAAMVLAVILGGCETASATGTPSPLAAESGAPGPSSVAAPPTAASSQGGSGSPSGPAIHVTGAYEASSDIKSTGSGSMHTAIHEIGSVTAAGGADGRLTGTATYTYRKDYEIGSAGCKTSWTTGDVTWDTPVTGTWQANADGSVAVSLLPDNRQGPGIPENYLCVGSITEHPDSAPFGGTLVNGTFDRRQDFISNGGGSGTDFSWVKWHLESAPRG